jgi:hypothetical protein
LFLVNVEKNFPLPTKITDNFKLSTNPSQIKTPHKRLKSNQLKSDAQK